MLLPLVVVLPLAAQQAGVELFEKEIRPVLVEKCYACHSTKLKDPMAGLALDSRAGLLKGGHSGPVIVPGKPAESRLLDAIRYTDTKLRMPPSGKLTDGQIAAFERWIAAGAPDPRTESAAGAPPPKKGMDLETGRKWWAFQAVAEREPPKVTDRAWVKKKVDAFVLAKLEAAKIAPSRPADSRTLIRRAYLDLTGLKPTYQEVEAFAADKSPDAYEKLIERLLASKHYGERWGRYWLDVARYAEDNPTSEATNPPYPFAWRYRDWVIEAVNRDVPYDRFVKLQLAADEMSGVPRSDYAALGFLGAAPIYHKDARLSRDVIETLFTDDWDERVDTVSRGLLGLTVACARCHDHKFDAIPTKDYYALAGVFASTVAVPRPMNNVDPESESKFMYDAQRMFFLSYVSNLMRNEPGTKPEESRQKAERYAAELQRMRADIEPWKDRYPALYRYLMQFGRPPGPRPAPAAGGVKPVAGAAAAAPVRRGRGRGPSTEPFFNAVFDAGVWVDGSDPDLTMLTVKPGVARDMNVLPVANVANPKELAPRRFLSVLSKDDTPFRNGSGRLELGERIFGDGAALAARVIVNRVWGWHFDKPLVGTPSDFGVQGEKPTHPELLDDLAARFIANGWSLKWLHREIMLSAAYRQDSHPRADALQKDATNELIWRMNPRRLDVEAFRDALLQAAGTLDTRYLGPSEDLDSDTNARRTVYGSVSRGRLNALLALYDFPEATLHSPKRDLTTTPLQQLFVMNSEFIERQAAALVAFVENEPDTNARVRAIFRRVLAREPTSRELDVTLSYLASGTLAQYAQALLSSNEVIFWP